MQTAPFNIEKALAGEPVVTRYGLSVRNFRVEGIHKYPLAAQIEERHETDIFTDEGKFSATKNEDHPFDLFMLINP